MAAANQTVARACRVIRSKLRLERASVRLPSVGFPHDQTPEIREALRLYVSSWIEPLLDAIEAGDTAELAKLIGHSDRECAAGEPWPLLAVTKRDVVEGNPGERRRLPADTVVLVRPANNLPDDSPIKWWAEPTGRAADAWPADCLEWQRMVGFGLEADDVRLVSS